MYIIFYSDFFSNILHSGNTCVIREPRIDPREVQVTNLQCHETRAREGDSRVTEFITGLGTGAARRATEGPSLVEERELYKRLETDDDELFTRDSGSWLFLRRIESLALRLSKEEQAKILQEEFVDRALREARK